MESFAGADLHKRVTQWRFSAKGSRRRSFVFPTIRTPFHGVLRKLPRGTKIEATGSWWWFVEKDIDTVFRAASKGSADAVLVLGNPILNAHRRQIVDLAVKHRLPTTYARPEFVEAGGLMFYGTSYNDLPARCYVCR